MPPVGQNATSANGLAHAFSIADAAGGARGKELEEAKALFGGEHHLARGRDAGQEREPQLATRRRDARQQPGLTAKRAPAACAARASAALRTVPAPTIASGTARAIASIAGQRRRRAQRHLEHADAALDERARHRHGMLDALDDDHRNHRPVPRELERIERLGGLGYSHVQAPSSAETTLRRMPANSSRPRPWPLRAAWLGASTAISARAAHSAFVDQRLERAGDRVEPDHVAVAHLGRAGRRRGFGADVDGGRHLARGAAHAPVGDQRDLEAPPLQHRQRRRQLVQLGHAVGARPLEAHDGDEVALERAGGEGGEHLFLRVEDERRRLDDPAVGGHRRDLDHGAAEVAGQQLQAAVGAERRARRPKHAVVAAGRRPALHAPSRAGRLRAAARACSRRGRRQRRWRRRRAGSRRRAARGSRSPGRPRPGTGSRRRCRWGRRAPAAARRPTGRRSRSSR